MSGAMRRIGEYLGLLEDTGYDEYDDEVAEQAPARETREPRPVRPVRAVPSSSVADLEERRRPVAVAPQRKTHRMASMRPRIARVWN